MRLACLAALVALASQAAEAPRVASFSPAATRILGDLGASRQVVAATRWCDLPPTHAASRDCDAFDPDLEALRRSGAGLVVLPRLANPMLAERVRSLGLRTLVLAAESPESPAADIASLAKALGKEAEGQRLLAARAACRHPANGKRVLILSDGFVAGPDSYLAWAIRAAGAETAADSGTWHEWDLESTVRSKPDIVITLKESGPVSPEIDSSSLERWRATPGLRATPAAQAGCVYHVKLTSDWLPASGLPTAAETLAAMLRK